MKRKKIIAGLMALSIIGTSSFVFNTVKAATTTPPTSKILVQATGQFTSNYVNVRLSKQDKGHWCWAATTQALLRSIGVDVSQSDIVMSAKNSYDDVSGDRDDIMKAIRHFANSSKYTGPQWSGPLSADQIKQEIDAKRPIIASVNVGRWHSVIIYGYQIQASGEFYVVYKSPDQNSITDNCVSYDHFVKGLDWADCVYGVGRR